MTTAHAPAATPAKLELRPARAIQEVDPGGVASLRVTIDNESPRPAAVRYVVIDLEAPDAGGSFAAPATETTLLSPSTWITLDASADVVPARGSSIVTGSVRVPTTATPGAYAVGVVVSRNLGPIGTNDAERTRSRVQLSARLASTIVVVVRGDARAHARIVGTTAPRFVWGADEPIFDVEVRNDGTTLLDLEAATELSAFGFVASRTLKSRELPALPGGSRSLRMRWTDRPWIGWFTPRLVVVGGEGSGVREELRLRTVFVLPPWWVGGALLACLVLGLTRRRRRHGDADRR